MNRHHRTKSEPLSVAAQIVGLPDLPMPEIKMLWKRLFDSTTPTHNRQFLERRIAYRLQEIEFRKIDPNLLDRNKRRIASLVETGQVKKRDPDYRPVAGTVLTREYRGVSHHVVSMGNGEYNYEGRIFQSLSIVAREITGTRWSGPVFFGLKALPPAKAATKRRGAR